MKYMLLPLIMAIAVGCGSEERTDKRTKESDLEILKNRIAKLELLAAIFEDAGQRPAFADCSVEPNDLAKKICNIAQAAVSDQVSILNNQFGEISKQFQDALFGPDCLDADVGGGCPSPSSLKGRVDTLETASATYAADIAQLQNDVSSLDSRMDDIEDRLDNFNGSGQSVEVVVSGLDADITALQNDIATIEGRLDDIEEVLNGDKMLEPVELCSTIANAGPVYEILFLNRSFNKVYAFAEGGGNRGLALLKDAASTGNVNLTTSIGTRTCRSVLFDLGSTLRLCWHVTDRAHSHANIITLHGSYPNPNLTCVGDL